MANKGIKALRKALPKMTPDKGTEDYQLGYEAFIDFLRGEVLHQSDACECEGGCAHVDCDCGCNTDEDLADLLGDRSFWPIINGWVTADERDLTDDEADGAEDARRQVANIAGLVRHH
ncbi:MAG: hypothetical protein WC876_06300 [Candidatus Thermoplasmatota archaeon]|jgi:hypothetical protein